MFNLPDCQRVAENKFFQRLTKNVQENHLRSYTLLEDNKKAPQGAFLLL